jgi:hypothetical protein
MLVACGYTVLTQELGRELARHRTNGTPGTNTQLLRDSRSLAGLKLEGAGTPDCKVVLDKPRASVKVALSEFLVKRSPRWLGKDLKPATFKFQIDTWAALELHLKKSGRQL